MSTLVEKEVHRQLLKLLPSIIASKKAPPKAWRLAATTHFFAAELASVAVGWGITTNTLALVISGRETTWKTYDFITIAAALVWTGFVLWLKRYKIAEKLTLREACEAAFKSFEFELYSILRQDEYPPKALIALGPRLEEAIKQHQAGFIVSPNEASVHAEVKAEAESLITRFKGTWQDQLGAGAGSAGGGGPG